MSDMVENLARAWAEIDGKGERFDKDKAGELDKLDGTYEGYMTEAQMLLWGSGLKDEIDRLRELAFEYINDALETSIANNEPEADIEYHRKNLEGLDD